MDGADSFLQMTLIGGLTDVVGVIGKFGDDVVILEAFVVTLLVELVRALEDDIFEDDEEVDEPLRVELEEIEVLELEVDLLEICVLVCCWSCCLHFALRFLNQTC